MSTVSGLGWLLVGCTGDRDGATDATGRTNVDADGPPVDANGPSIDAGGPPVDAGGPPVDAGGPPVDASVAEWAPGDLFFDVGASATVQLANTLPPSAQRGGVFFVDPAGHPLPEGMTLTKDGELSVGTAAVGTTEGVIFSYEEP